MKTKNIIEFSDMFDWLTAMLGIEWNDCCDTLEGELFIPEEPHMDWTKEELVEDVEYLSDTDKQLLLLGDIQVISNIEERFRIGFKQAKEDGNFYKFGVDNARLIGCVFLHLNEIEEARFM